MNILQLFFGRVSLHFVKFIRRDNSLWKEWVHRTAGTSQILSSTELNIILRTILLAIHRLNSTQKIKTSMNFLLPNFIGYICSQFLNSVNLGPP